MKRIRELKSELKALASDELPYHWLECYLLFVINKDKAFLITDGDYLLSADQYQKLTKGIEKLTQKIPLAYLIGEQEFYGRVFGVNKHTLIPRPDTEILVDIVLSFVKQYPNRSNQLLDLGTGTGCIALTLAKELPNSQVLAVDFSQQALFVANQNKERLHADNCTFIHSNWYERIGGQTFDVIVSNPPYIDKHDEHLTALIAEPITALVADEGGLSDIMLIINQAKNHLQQGGLLAIEHGHNQGMSVQRLFEQAGFGGVMTIKDYGGNDRVTQGIWGSHD